MSHPATEKTFALPSEMTILHAALLRESLLQAVSEGVSAWDGHAVESIDSSGIQVLLALRRSLQAQQVGWSLCDPSGALLDALRLYGLADLAQSPQ
ncbi:MAG: STAS domain-containing protein [Burkholderiales bacterium]|nr:STAS domain-containing protein [Burkholderiales bacterium]